MYKNNNINYILSIQGRNNTIFNFDNIDKNGLTINFNVDKTYTNETNTCNIDIYNLSKDTRNLLKKTVLDTDYRQLILSVGYNGLIYPIFIGSVKECCSNRQENNFITSISAWDGGEAMKLSHSNISIRNNTDIFNQLAKDLNNIKIGFISQEAKYKLREGSRGFVISGKTWELLKKYQNYLQIFINNEYLYIYTQEEWSNKIININKETGLLDTPVDYGGTMEIKTIGEPNIDLKDIVKLEVEEDAEYNGEYGVISINHNGNISSIGGTTNWQTNITLQKEIYKNEK